MREMLAIIAALSLALLAACGVQQPAQTPETGTEAGRTAESETSDAPETGAATEAGTYAEPGTESERGFVLDNVLHSAEGDIHYNLYTPASYDGTEPYALFVTLAGYEGLYFQGVGANLAEDFGFTAQSYNERMLVLAPQLSDWGETSARQTIALVEYFLAAYNIDPARVYLHGMSGGGETASLVMGMRPELFAACLVTSTRAARPSPTTRASWAGCFHMRGRRAHLWSTPSGVPVAPRPRWPRRRTFRRRTTTATA